MGFKAVVFLSFLLIGILPTGFTQLTDLLPFASSHGLLQYQKGSILETNLNKVLDDLAQNTTATGFNTTSYGQDPNKVYGLLQCRGDPSLQQCPPCSHNALTYAMGTNSGCNSSIDCTLRFERCFLHYSNRSFFSVLDSGFSSLATIKNSSSPAVFAATLEGLLSNLSAEAPKPGKWASASGSSTYSSSSSSDLERVDGAVECTRDLSSANCSSCLSAAVKKAVSGGNLKAKYFNDNCLISYNSSEVFPSTNSGNDSNSMKPPRRWEMIGSLAMAVIGTVIAW